MKDNKLNNLLSIDDFTEKEIFKNSKVTKRTEVAKDIFESKEESGGKEITEKPKSKEEHTYGKLNNLCDLDNFTDKEFFKKYSPTKRTDVGKDILKEFKNIKDEDDDDDDEKYEKKGKVVKKLKDDDKDDKDKKGAIKKVSKDDDEKEEKTGLSAAQKKLPEGLQKAILNRKKK
jgi:hypothetical protein